MDSYTVRKIEGWTDLLDSYRVWDKTKGQPICICDTREDADRIAALLNADENRTEAPPQDENCTCPGFHTGECRNSEKGAKNE